MLKVALVGCGKIADVHASQIKKIHDCEIVAACDNEPLMAEQLAERFQIKNFYGDLQEMLRMSRPDVVHVTTPPGSHFTIAKTCLERGCHVYVEKPFTLYSWETEELIARANSASLKMTAGHDAQFSHAARGLRQLVREGYLGGDPVHMESVWCYELSGQAYAKALLSDTQHWARTLPGGLLHNIVSHGISKIAEFLTGDSPEIIAHAFVSPFLRNLGERRIVDELRAILSENERTTAYFTFSSQMRPALHQFSVFGPKNGAIIDEDRQTLVRLEGKRQKSYFEKFFPPLKMAKEYAGNSLRNMKLFLNRDFHMESGMKCLIESFYNSIRNQAPPPIPYREIILTARIMDAIFKQISRPTAPDPAVS